MGEIRSGAEKGPDRRGSSSWDRLDRRESRAVPASRGSLDRPAGHCNNAAEATGAPIV